MTQPMMFEVPITNPTGNKMIVKYGHGPKGKKCRHCKFWIKVGKYHKCEIFGVTHGEATDHPGKHNTCGMFKENQE